MSALHRDGTQPAPARAQGLAPELLRLADLPPGSRLHWYSDDLTPARPYSWGWVDVHVPEAEGDREPAPWSLAIVPCDEPEPPAHHVATPNDLDLHEVLTAPSAFAIAVAAYAVPTGSFLGAVESDHLRAELAADPRRRRSIRPAWSASAVTAALNRWAAQVLGRPDLSFAWDEQAGPSPLLRRAIEQASQAAESPRIDTGIPGVTMTERAFDGLLAIGPDAAADVMTIVRSIVLDTDHD